MSRVWALAVTIAIFSSVPLWGTYLPHLPNYPLYVMLALMFIGVAGGVVGALVAAERAATGRK